MDDAITFLNAKPAGLGYGFTHDSRPGFILVVLDGDMAHLDDIVNDADRAREEITKGAFAAWLNDADLEAVPADPAGCTNEYHAEIRAEWVLT